MKRGKELRLFSLGEIQQRRGHKGRMRRSCGAGGFELGIGRAGGAILFYFLFYLFSFSPFLHSKKNKMGLAQNRAGGGTRRFLYVPLFSFIFPLRSFTFLWFSFTVPLIVFTLKGKGFCRIKLAPASSAQPSPAQPSSSQVSPQPTAQLSSGRPSSPQLGRARPSPTQAQPSSAQLSPAQPSSPSSAQLSPAQPASQSSQHSCSLCPDQGC